MKILQIEQNSEEWFETRKGKITGSKLKDVVTKRGTAWKIGVYQLIADRIAVDADEEDPMERGHRLEKEAIEKFTEETGIPVEEGAFWVSDKNPNIAVSPDGVTDGDGAVEVKCLSSARHLQALIEETLPKEYKEQVLQYFIVNDDLQTVYTVFYDPRIQSKPYFVIPTHREDVAKDIEFLEEYQVNILAEVDKWVEKLTF